MEFFQTVGGQRFINGTVPRLINAMESLAKEMKRYNDLKEIELKTWEKTEESDQVPF